MSYKRNKLKEYVYGAFQLIGGFTVMLLLGIDWDHLFPLLGM